ncbi:MAG TPA: TolC family protein [Ignavibacteriales bacterium]|nr:TolC family protein [Ignavibacteriales bacterium]
MKTSAVFIETLGDPISSKPVKFNGAVYMFRYLFIIIFFPGVLFSQQRNIIYLTWDKVISVSLDRNLSLKSKMLEYDLQRLEVWRSYSNFLPSITYQALGVKNLELPTIVFMGQRFTMGTNYTFQHSMDLTFPVFTGGSRLFGLKVQTYLRKSLSEELKGKKQDAVLEALESYYGIILAESLLRSALNAVQLADSNLRQVTLFYNHGTATELDLQRARAQYYSVLPQLENASSNRLLSYQRLKMVLNIPFEDSVVVADSMAQKDFLDKFKGTDLTGYKNILIESRPELKAASHRLDASGAGEKLALAEFSPVLTFSANLLYQAYSDNDKLMWKDYIRSKAISLSIYWPLFEGGRKLIDYQEAKIRTDAAGLLRLQLQNQFSLEVEQNYYKFNEALKNLQSLEEALKQSRESLRLSNLLYSEGMTTQLDVLNAQFLYNSSRVQYLQGIYNYNVIQLMLLKSIGKLNTIWE